MTSPDKDKTPAEIEIQPPEQFMSEEEIRRWTAYRDKLHRIICAPENGMLLDATRYLDPSGETIEIPGAAFHLTSGRYRRQFISIWELFDHPVEFDECIGMLVERAAMIRRKIGAFNMIVTCTHTSREMVRHMRPQLGRMLDNDIEVSEFGHYPHDSPDQLELHAFRSRRVLIFTDVMASGSLVRDMALRVTRTGGDVIGVLAVVLSDAALVKDLDSQGVVNTDLKLGVDGIADIVPIHALTSVEIKELEEGDFDPSKLRKIDFVSVFPEAPPEDEQGGNGPNGQSAWPSDELIRAGFTREEMMVHFLETDALIHGHFASDSRLFTLGVRINRLLDSPHASDEIWKRIRQDCPADHVLVCTFKKNDLLFTRFVQQRLREEGAEVPFYVLKRELGDFPHLHQALYPHTHRVRGRSVVLLRATATTSEELRSIAALLAAENVTSITVICLVNRMGKYTVSFVRRVKELMTTQQREPAAFKFVQVYHLTDLRTDDLAEMQRRLDNVLDKYIRVTEVPYFKFLAEDFRRALAPASSDTMDFEAPRKSDLGLVLADIVHEMSEHRIDKLLALIRRTTAVGTPLDAFREEEIYLPIARLVVSDVDYLRLSKHLRIIMEALHTRLSELRRDRFKEEEEFHRVSGDSFSWDEFETSPSYQRIMGNLRTETHLIFSLALLAHFDKTDLSEKEILEEILFDRRTMEDWFAHPLNLRYHFREAGAYWLASFMLHAIHPDFFSQASEAAKRMELAHWLRDRFDEMLGGLPIKTIRGEDEKTLLEGQIRGMKNHLLSQLGAHARGLWHQCVRFLQHHVLHRNEGHSPIWTALKSLETDFEVWLEDPKKHFTMPLLVKMSRHSQEALNAAITLREISEAAHRLASYPNHEVGQALRAPFGNPNSRESFEQTTVTPLLEWIRSHQDSPPSSMNSFHEFKKLVWQVKQTVFEPTCPFRNALLSFCVSLEDVLEDAIGSVNARLETEGFRDVWNLARDLHISAGTNHLVLCERHLLLEVLRNLLSNVRYAVDAPFHGALLGKVRMEIRVLNDKLPEPENSDHEFVCLVVETSGIPFTKRVDGRRLDGGTIRSHEARVQEFGGHLTVSDGDSGSGSKAVLKLISRQNYIGIRRH